jgi:Tat protein secretion system quality control protein TatD with DNase activity
MVILPFDAHNHVHMGPTRPLVAMLRHVSSDINSNSNKNNNVVVALGGMALMSTHPRDYPKVLDLCYHTLPQEINELYCSTTTTTASTTIQEDGSRTTTLPPLPIFIPCLGVHPWFVNDLTEDDWQLVNHNHTTYYDDDYTDGRDGEREMEEEKQKNSGTLLSLPHHQVPRWIQELEEHLLIDPPNSPLTTSTSENLPQQDTTTPSPEVAAAAATTETASPLRPPPPLRPPIVVGEIGLDKFQFHPTTKELRCPMEIQIKAFYYQFELATRLERPVSLHCVHAMGPMVQVIRDVQRSYQKLPPKLYFHAFGGKEATVDQLVSLVDKANQQSNAKHKKAKAQAKKDKQKRIQEETKKTDNTSSIEKEDVESLLSASAASSSTTSTITVLPTRRTTTTATTTTTPTKLYFGFAPVINFRSPKTANVIQKVGLDRLVLETDHEDATFVPEAMILGIALLSKVLNVPPEQVIAQTTANAMELYGILPSSSDSSLST